MFSLYLTKMNVVFSDFNMDKIDFSKIHTMKYLHDYLDNDWNIMKKKNTEKKIKSSVYYDKDVSEMLQKMMEKYHLPRNRIHNMVLRKYLPDAMIWS